MESPDPSSEMLLSRPGIRIASIRIVALGLTGAVAGWISCWISVSRGIDDETWNWIVGPGLIYGCLWIALSWIPGCLTVRRRARNSWRWTLLFLAGMILSYYTAFYSAHLLGSELGPQGYRTTSILAVSGFSGGIPGSIGLVCMWSLLFPAADSWATRSILVFFGAMLGASLAIWEIDDDPYPTLYWFFAIWQGGMAIAFAIAESVWRNRADDADYFHP